MIRSWFNRKLCKTFRSLNDLMFCFISVQMRRWTFSYLFLCVPLVRLRVAILYMAAFQQHKSMQKLECIFYLKIDRSRSRRNIEKPLISTDDALSLPLFSGTCKQSKGLSAGTLLQHFVYTVPRVLCLSLSLSVSVLRGGGTCVCIVDALVRPLERQNLQKQPSST